MGNEPCGRQPQFTLTGKGTATGRGSAMVFAIRMATPDDASACLAIYAPIVEQTSISFELAPPTDAEMRDRITKALLHSLWIVCDTGERVVGYAYGSQYRARPAYAWTAETTVYVDDSCRRNGVGRALYDVLLAALRAEGFRSAVAGITLPNEASVRLHETMGFCRSGIVRDAGNKFDRWHDVGFWQVGLGPGSAPRPTLAAAELAKRPGWAELLGGPRTR